MFLVTHLHAVREFQKDFPAMADDTRGYSSTMESWRQHHSQIFPGNLQGQQFSLHLLHSSGLFTALPSSLAFLLADLLGPQPTSKGPDGKGPKLRENDMGKYQRGAVSIWHQYDCSLIFFCMTWSSDFSTEHSHRVGPFLAEHVMKTWQMCSSFASAKSLRHSLWKHERIAHKQIQKIKACSLRGWQMSLFEDFGHHLQIFGDYIPNSWVIFNLDIYKRLFFPHGLPMASPNPSFSPPVATRWTAEWISSVPRSGRVRKIWAPRLRGDMAKSKSKIWVFPSPCFSPCPFFFLSWDLPRFSTQPWPILSKSLWPHLAWCRPAWPAAAALASWDTGAVRRFRWVQSNNPINP